MTTFRTARVETFKEQCEDLQILGSISFDGPKGDEKGGNVEYEEM